MLTKTLFKLITTPKQITTFQHLLSINKKRTISCYTTATKNAATAQPDTHSILSYNPEESEKIVNVINNSNSEQLLSFEISKANLGKLQSWMKKNGPLHRPQDLLCVDGLSLKLLQKFCRSLLDEGTAKGAVKASPRTRTAPFIIPSLGSEQRQQIRSCVAIRIAISSISWTRLELPNNSAENAPCLLTDWQHHEIKEKKLHLSELVQRCLYLNHLIPAADCYLCENPQMAQANNNPGNPEQQNINIQKAQITAVLSFALSARRHIFEPNQPKEQLHENISALEKHIVDTHHNKTKDKPLPNVFYLRRFLTARLFNHLVGTERVSSEQTILNLMRTYYNVEERYDYLVEDERVVPPQEEKILFRGNVQFPSELRHMFSNAERYQREFLGQALLLNLAFVRLVLLQDAESIVKVTRNPNKLSEPNGN